MKNILGLVAIPLLCMAVTILTALVIIVALRRGTRGINEQAEKVIREKKQTPDANTRWARGDMQGETRKAANPPAVVNCPACGGENIKGSTTCAYCGRGL